MNIHERLEAFWSGEKPDRIPYTIYQNEWRHTQNDPAWQPLLEAGLGVTWQVPSVKMIHKDVEFKQESYTENGRKFTRSAMVTPVGEIFTIAEDGWTQKYWLETQDDYRVMTYIARHTEYEPDYAGFLAKQEQIKPYGIALIAAGRTPLQTILVDYVGLENFAYHLFDFESELAELYDALLAGFRRKVELIAAGPGRFVSVLENFTAETMGPARFAQYHVPVYKELFPILQQSGKIVGTHYDGKLASCRDHIAGAPIDLIESLTPPPEGDMTLDECRAAWPEKLFWVNINVANYELPPKELKNLVAELVRQGAPDGRRLAFEVSEQYPHNWKQSMPVVLQALNEIEL
ncbi:MAG TPA: hypothetical protein PK828_03380 [Limnochordia bacterium]|nr:hypothetical protein [Limnochordia bacterium]HXK96900.1 hypothetical protein [Limnochordia bacterium]